MLQHSSSGKKLGKVKVLTAKFFCILLKVEIFQILLTPYSVH